MNMENEQKEQAHGNKPMVCTSGHTCMSGGCGCGHHHMHIMKWLIKIALLIIVFCFAFKMGEIKGMLEGRGFYGNSQYGRGGMMLRYGNDVGGEYGPTTMMTPGTPTAPSAQ